MPRVRVGDWDIVLLERVYEGIMVSAGERCPEHPGEKERVEDRLKERKGTRDGQRRASCGIKEGSGVAL